MTFSCWVLYSPESGVDDQLLDMTSDADSPQPSRVVCASSAWRRDRQTASKEEEQATAEMVDHCRRHHGPGLRTPCSGMSQRDR